MDNIYNDWLPPPVAAQTSREKDSFSDVVRSVRDSYRPDDPESVYSTLKWISLINLFVKAKSEVSMKDVHALIEMGLELFHMSHGKLYVQFRWGDMLVTLLHAYRRQISVKIEWRPLYETLMNTHFNDKTGPEGSRLRQRHLDSVISLVVSSRRFFPSPSASEIWTEVKTFLENPWHESSLAGSWLLSLFLPANLDNRHFFSQKWIKECIALWESLPNSQFWNCKWAIVIARVVKNCSFLDWEYFLPTLYSRYLNLFEVPIANGSESYPCSFPGDGMVNPEKFIAKAIVYLFKPGGSAQWHFEKLVNILEQYYHPSNGGSWSSSLASFLQHLVNQFQQRLKIEQLNTNNSRQAENCLGAPERTSFVNSLLKLIERGLYSKSENLCQAAVAATSVLSFVEPSLVLPFIASRFHIALETVTATHQLTTAVTSVACVGRSLCLASLSASSTRLDDFGSKGEAFMNLMEASFFNALLGMDANDPPKTIATMQLLSAIFSNFTVLDDNLSFMPPSMCFSEWLDKFLSRLFSLLICLEPVSLLDEGLYSSEISGTFLTEDESYYLCMLEILLGRLSKPLYIQALKTISKFVKTNILPGVVSEVGWLCFACVEVNPLEAVSQLVEPILLVLLSSLKETPHTGYGGRGALDASVSNKVKSTLSPATETSIVYYLYILSASIQSGGPVLLHYKDQIKESILLAFDSPSWKVNEAGRDLLRSLLCSLVHYYPVDQFKCISIHPDAAAIEEWTSKLDYPNNSRLRPNWHIPSDEELQFANELLDIHLRSALDDLLIICQNKIHSVIGEEKEHLKVTLLRIKSSLEGVGSCLPDFIPSSKNGMVHKSGHTSFLLAGAIGPTVGSTALRENAAKIVHQACQYILEKKAYDDSIHLTLVISIMNALGNYGNLEYKWWSSHVQDVNFKYANIMEPPVNLIVASHSKQKRRPRWVLIDKVFLHNIWRSSKSSYYLYRTSGNFYPPDDMVLLMDDLLKLSLHSYGTVRIGAGIALKEMMKRWPSTISKYIFSLSGNLKDPNSAECVVLGSCFILSSYTVLRHLTMDPGAFSSFIIGILLSSRHESLRAHQAIYELFVEYNNEFFGLSRSIFGESEDHASDPVFSDLFSQIGSMCSDTIGLHWRYNLMAHRALLLLVMSSRNHPNSSSKVLCETAGHFLRNLTCQFPHTILLAISALNILLQEPPCKLSVKKKLAVSEGLLCDRESSCLEGTICQTFQKEGFLNDMLNCLSNAHMINDTETESSEVIQGSSFLTDRSISDLVCVESPPSWPRTLWFPFDDSDPFDSKFAHMFKSVAKECGMDVLLPLRSTLEEFTNAEEKSKKCVAAEALAGLLHSDISGLLETWESWMMPQLKNMILSQSLESIPEWSSCIRYAVTGKGKYGTKVPLLKQQILECLMTPLPPTVTALVTAKRYAFLCIVLVETSPQRMTVSELELHIKLQKELLSNMCHSSDYVRTAVGTTLSVLCSNIRLYGACQRDDAYDITDRVSPVSNKLDGESWVRHLTSRAAEAVKNIHNSNPLNGDVNDDSQDDVKWMETLLNFMISCFESGRSSYLLDVLAGLIYPVISLQETPHENLSTMAEKAFDLLKWRIFWEPHLFKVVDVILAAATDSNWRTRFAILTFLHTFLYRHTFILSDFNKQQIWITVEKLLMDNHVEVREHAAVVLAGLMKSGDEDLAKDFRHRAYFKGKSLQRRSQTRRRLSSGQSIASTHGVVLALAASILSSPYDIPSWLPDHVTLLAHFAEEPSPVKSTVTKVVAEFRRTHADTWEFQKDLFTEEQLEVLAGTSSSSSYFA